MQIYIADSCAIYRAGLKETVQREFPDARIVENLLPDLADVFARSSEGDIALVHIEKVTEDLARFSKYLKSKKKSIKILVISDYPDYWHAKRLLRNGVKGLIPKNIESQEIRKAINTVLAGDIYVESNLLIDLLMLGPILTGERLRDGTAIIVETNKRRSSSSRKK